MKKFINYEEAIDFNNQIEDPIVRELVTRAYGTLIFELSPIKVDGQFDLLFFFKVLEKFLSDLRDPESLISGLVQNISERNVCQDEGAPDHD